MEMVSSSAPVGNRQVRRRAMPLSMTVSKQPHITGFRGRGMIASGCASLTWNSDLDFRDAIGRSAVIRLSANVEFYLRLFVYHTAYVYARGLLA